MTGEPPGELPDTADPFELLGIERSADERAARRAYATLIKRYRPDRRPAEFQRIHAAFETVKAYLTFAPDLVDARARGAADLDPIAAPVAGAAPDPPTPDREEAPDQAPAIDPRAEVRALGERSVADAEAYLARPELIQATAAIPAAATEVLRALSALAWRDPAAADRVAALHDFCHGLDVDLRQEMFDSDRELAAQLAASGEVLPAPFDAALRGHAGASATRRDALRLALRRKLFIEEQAYRALLDRLAAERPTLAAALATWCALRTPERGDSLAALPRPVFEQLSARLWRNDVPWYRWVWFAALAALPVLLVAPPAVATFVVLGGGLAVLVLVWWLALERGRYQHEVRVRLRGVALETGVNAELIRQWIVANRRLAGSDARFDVAIEADQGLALWGAIAAFCHPRHASG